MRRLPLTARLPATAHRRLRPTASAALRQFGNLQAVIRNVKKQKAYPLPTESPQFILFDFDYTLADSSQGAIECVNYALEKMALPKASDEEICQTIGLSLPKTFQALVENHHEYSAQDFDDLFMHRADQVMADLTEIFPSVKPTIHALKLANISLGIVSTKSRRRIVAILEREGLLDHFPLILGGGDVPVQKPDPAGIHIAIDRLGCNSSDIVYVGDSITDAETAQRGNVRFIAVLTGTTLSKEFEPYAPFAVIDNMAELPKILAN